MSKHGQYNYKGINTQAWAAMSLFLQYLRNPNFSYIHLEANKFEDFNLVFNDDQKIVCESKDYKKEISYYELKKILNTILKKNQISEKDEILIICTRVNKSLKSNVENIKYWKQPIRAIFRKHKFTDEQINVLDKVKFWIIDVSINEKVVYALFSELIGFWLPTQEVRRNIHDILIRKIYKGSSSGDIFKKDDILLEFENLKQEVIKRSGYFDRERRKTETMLQEIIQAINDNRSPAWSEVPLTAISAQPNLMGYIIGQFEKQKIDNLQNWEKLWQANKICWFSLHLFKIFKENLHNRDNRSYVIDFIEKNINEIRGYYRHDYFELDVINILSTILEHDRTYTYAAFNITKKILSSKKKDYFYLKTEKDLSYEKTKCATLLNKIYDYSNQELKNAIYSFILESFNLIEDSGEFSHYAPLELFNILEKYLIDNWDTFESKFKQLSRSFSKQFDLFYKKFGEKVLFNGWEIMGGVSTYWGGNYIVEDRHFIRYVFQPALEKYYRRNKHDAWTFIVNECVSMKVTKNAPDFLNRATLPIVLQRYKLKNSTIYKQVFKILKDFILQKKGIPHKSEIIHQALMNDFTDAKKWKLIKISIAKYNIPIDPFIEQIVYNLAKKNHKVAKKIVKTWIKNAKYYERSFFAGKGVANNIATLIEDSFNLGFDLFKTFIRSDYFIYNLDNFDVYKVSGLLSTVLKKKFKSGLEILKELKNKRKLSKNQQTLMCFSILKFAEESKGNNKNITKIYNQFIHPFLNDHKRDIDKIVNYIWHSNAREAFVQFAEKMAKIKLIKEALDIVEIFINDPDPYLPGEDPEDPEAKYSHHKKMEETGQGESVINSVRGWCSWVLTHSIVIEGRPHLNKAIKLTKKLTEDASHYIKHMACNPLSRLVCYRLSHLPGNKKKLFFNDNLKTSLLMAKEVEGIALEMLDDVMASSSNAKKALSKSIMRVFNCLRTLNETEAYDLLTKLSSFPDEAIHDSTFLFIYYIEYRKTAFKNWKYKTCQLYNNLEKFDDRKIKELLECLMLRSPETRAAFSWKFFQITDRAKRKVKNSLEYNDAFKLSLKYLPRLISEYDHQTYENTYRFIENNIEKPHKFEKCYNLWKKCLVVEKSTLSKLIKTERAHDIYWWPYYHNGKLLTLIYRRRGMREFLDVLEYLSDYPQGLYIGDISEAVTLLKKCSKSNKQAKKIFKNLIERNVKHYNDKQEWLKQ